MRQVALVFVCGGLGSAARFLLGSWVLRALGSGFAYGTVAINTLGSFLLVVVMQLALGHVISADVRLALATGLLGGFTTYSAFNYETLAFFQQGAWTLGVLNVGATLFGCLAAGGLGLVLGRLLIST